MDLLSSIASGTSSVISVLLNLCLAIILLIVAFFVSGFIKGVVKKLLSKVKFPETWKNKANMDFEKTRESVISGVSNLVYIFVFILFLPPVLDLLKLPTISAPIVLMMSSILGFIPNLIIAMIVLVIGFFIASIVRDICNSFLDGINFDKSFNKYVNKQDQEPNQSISKILSNVLYGVLLIAPITIALQSLKINTLTDPIVNMLNAILLMIPNVFVAIALVVIGYYISKFVSDLLIAILKKTNIDYIYESVGIQKSSKFDLSFVIGKFTQILIMIFFTVQALEVLNLHFLNQVGLVIVAYMPRLLSAFLILWVGLFASSLVYKSMQKLSVSNVTALVVKVLIMIVTIFMTLEQLQFAPYIVNSAFIIILTALAVAFALAFGIGGRDFAKQHLEHINEYLKNKKNEQENK